MRAADSAPTPPLHVTLRLPRAPTHTTNTPSNGVASGGRLAAVTGVAGASGGARSDAPLIIIGSTAHVSCCVVLQAAVSCCCGCCCVVLLLQGRMLLSPWHMQCEGKQSVQFACGHICFLLLLHCI